MNIRFRISTAEDLDYLVELEAESFPDYKRSSRRSIKRGLDSAFQEIIIAEVAAGGDGLPASAGSDTTRVGALFLFRYPRSLRIYSIAVGKAYRGKGYGEVMLAHVFNLARERGLKRVLAEVSTSDQRLVNWYVSRGFVATDTLPGYYGADEDGVKLEYVCQPADDVPAGGKQARSRPAFLLLTALFVMLFIGAGVQAQSYQPDILNLREQARVLDEWAVYRLDHLVGPLMRREGIDMWVLVAREYNEDPVLLTMLPATWQSSRRTTILVFFDPGEGQSIERFAVSRYDIGFFQTQWFVDQEPDQWKRFGELVAERNPRRIGVNFSKHHSLADGIAYSDFNDLQNSLTETLRARIVSAESLGIGWLETRTPQEMMVYRQVSRIAHTIIEEGLSEAVITPGITTTEDLQWWFRERMASLNLTAWFHPSVQVIRREQPVHDGDFSGGYSRNVIQFGDIIHMDLGITYLRLSTDTQRNAYVLRPGETAPPAGLQEAMRIGNRLQDILTGEFRTGRTGNEILASALAKARSEGIKATIYTHPIGYHGHAAGTTIGLWDAQGGVSGAGDYPLYPNTAHSIELNAEVFIPEWGRSIRIMLEENALFDGEKVWYIDGRMTQFYLIPR